MNKALSFFLLMMTLSWAKASDLPIGATEEFWAAHHGKGLVEEDYGRVKVETFTLSMFEVQIHFLDDHVVQYFVRHDDKSPLKTSEVLDLLGSGWDKPDLEGNEEINFLSRSELDSTAYWDEHYLLVASKGEKEAQKLLEIGERASVAR